MGIRISQPTIQRILREHGFSPFPGRKIDFERVRSAAKDAVWAVDFFAVKTTKGVWLQALVVIDLYTRELLELRVHDGWDVDAAWTARVVGSLLRRTKRKPAKLVHDHGPHFLGAFSRALRVLDVEEELTPPGLPSMNCFAERAIWSVRYELLRHVPIENAERLQFYLDEYRMYANADRSHQGLLGRTPADVASARPLAPVLDLEAVRARRLARRSYAHGLLQSYDLVEGEQPRQAALPPAFATPVAPPGLAGPDGLPLPAARATARLVAGPMETAMENGMENGRAPPDGGVHSAGSVSFRLSGAPLRPSSARIPANDGFLGSGCRSARGAGDERDPTRSVLHRAPRFSILLCPRLSMAPHGERSSQALDGEPRRPGRELLRPDA